VAASAQKSFIFLASVRYRRNGKIQWPVASRIFPDAMLLPFFNKRKRWPCSPFGLLGVLDLGATSVLNFWILSAVNSSPAQIPGFKCRATAALRLAVPASIFGVA
jgi:hypothetical protein